MLCWLALLLPAHAATLDVGPGHTYASISAAITAARDGDTVQIHAGTYDELVVIDELEVALTGVGTVAWIGAEDSLLKIYDSEVSLTGITFHPSGGRAIRTERAVVRVEACTFSGNHTADAPYNGAAMAVYNSSDVEIIGSTFSDNLTEPDFFSSISDGRGGHLYILDSDVLIEGTTFTEGEATDGGALYIADDASVTLRDSTFTHHHATDEGGVIYLGEGTLTVTGTRFEASSAGTNGGVLRWYDDYMGGPVSFSSSTFIGNSSEAYGGVIAINTAGDLTLEDNSFVHSASGAGGAISVFQAGELVARRNTFCDSRADNEGGALRVRDSGPGEWLNNVFVRSAAGAEGGGVLWAEDSDRQYLTNNDLLDSAAQGNGGAILSRDTELELTNNLIAWTGAGYGVAASGDVPDTSFTAWFANQPGDAAAPATMGRSALTVDPDLLAYRRNDDCFDDDLRLHAGSPLIDAGDPSISDPDGSRSDIGAFGGRGAPDDLFDDHDGDGTIGAYDCDDADGSLHPGQPEICDGLDNDCDGEIDQPSPAGAPTYFIDGDGDGWGDASRPVVACFQPPETATRAGDCDDAQADISPAAEERCDGLDNDCDGTTDGPDAIDRITWHPDADGDGFGAVDNPRLACVAPAGHVRSDTDCEDDDPAIHPEADERCDGLDNNCDQRVDGDDAIDKLPWYADLDGDGWGIPGDGTRYACDAIEGLSRSDRDCDDADDTVHPYAPEDCASDVDRNCDGSTGDADLDADGFRACEDCDDTNPTIYPGAPETWYDGQISDCDSSSDFDADFDGYEAEDWGGDDCDDTDGAVNPAASERHDDNIDNDCDGIIGTDQHFGEDLKVGCGCSAAVGGTSPLTPMTSVAPLLGLLMLSLRRRR